MTTGQVVLALTIPAVTLAVNAFISITVKHSTSPADAYAKFRRAALNVWNLLCVAWAIGALLYFGLLSPEPVKRGHIFMSIIIACGLTAAAILLMLRKVIDLVTDIVNALGDSGRLGRAHLGLTGRVVGVLEKQLGAPEKPGDKPQQQPAEPLTPQ